MIRKTLRQLLDELTRLHGLLGDVERRLDRIEVVSMVREPSTNAAADAYEGLRRQVVAGASARMAHLAQVVEFDLALARGADRAVLGTLVEGWIAQAGVTRIEDPGHADADLLFELVDDRGGPLVVLEAAYRDTATGRVVRQGRALREDRFAAVAAHGDDGGDPGSGNGGGEQAAAEDLAGEQVATGHAPAHTGGTGNAGNGGDRP